MGSDGQAVMLTRQGVWTSRPENGVALSLARAETREGCLRLTQLPQVILSLPLLPRCNSWGILGFQAVILGPIPKKGR